MLARGSLFLNSINFVRDRYGVEALPRIVKGLSGRHAASFAREIGEDSWEPVEALVDYMETAKRLLAGEDADFYRSMGVFGGHREVDKSVGDLVKDLDAALRLSRVLWRHFFDTGDLEVVERDAHGVTLRLRDFPVPGPLCPRLVGSMEGLLSRVGLPVRVEESGCQLRGDPHCELRLTWAGTRRAATRYGPYDPARTE